MDAQTVIVTGASRGLGAAIAHNLGKLGANVVLTARDAEALQHVADEIETDTLVVAGDISHHATCGTIVNRTIERFGGIDTVVNNASVLEPISSISEASPLAWQHSWAVNVMGPLMLIQASLPQLRERRGRVINVSTDVHFNQVPGWGAYSATKAALDQLNAIISAEEPGITAVAFRPEPMDTAFQTLIRDEGLGTIPKPIYERFLEMHKEGELLDPDLPAQVAAILALYAPLDWSGQFIDWNDERVRRLSGRVHHHEAEEADEA